MSQARAAAITQTIGKIKVILDEGVDVARLNDAKVLLMQLAAREDLFPYTDFPIPSEEDVERTDLVYEESDGSYALYVNSSRPGQQSRPHDHGGAWAIVAAVKGAEEHRVYALENASESDAPWIRQSGLIEVKPGNAISMLPDGIHSIHAVADAPLMHLHLYGKSFRLQGERKEYDLEHRTIRAFVLDDLGFIQDKR